MAALARGGADNPAIRFLANDLVMACDCQKCLECIVVSIGRWVREHYQYINVDTEDTEVLATPAYCVNQIIDNGIFAGDCAIVSTFVASLYKALGIETRYVAIKAVNPEFFSHVYVEALAAGQWINVDLTVPEGTIHKHFGRLVQNV